MPRTKRLVVPGFPHHVTQRGARRQRTFFCDDDYREFLAMLERELPRAGVEVWAYCLMPNHVHLVAVPSTGEGLAKLFRVVHRRYACRINCRNDWQGHLWQERFHSVVLNERHLLAAVRYDELNPVRAGLCRRPEDWRWSSARAHICDQPSPIVTHTPVLNGINDWSAFLAVVDEGAIEAIRKQTRSGRPSGDSRFIEKLEAMTGRRLRRRKPGRKRRK